MLLLISIVPCTLKAALIDTFAIMYPLSVALTMLVVALVTRIQVTANQLSWLQLNSSKSKLSGRVLSLSSANNRPVLVDEERHMQLVTGYW
jgi:hypothetical protein